MPRKYPHRLRTSHLRLHASLPNGSERGSDPPGRPCGPKMLSKSTETSCSWEALEEVLMPTGNNAVHVERPDESGSLRSAPDYLVRPKAAPISSAAAVKLSRSKLAPYRSRGSDDQIPELLCVTRKKVGEARRPAFGTANSHAASWALTSQKSPPPDRLTCLLLLTPRSEDLAQPCHRECTPYSPTREPLEISRFARTCIERLLPRQPRRLQT